MILSYSRLVHLIGAPRRSGATRLILSTGKSFLVKKVKKGQLMSEDEKLNLTEAIDEILGLDEIKIHSNAGVLIRRLAEIIGTQQIQIDLLNSSLQELQKYLRSPGEIKQNAGIHRPKPVVHDNGGTPPIDP